MYFPRLLIANRGEIAVRIIRACRELGIETVAVYSDADAGALHVRLADAAVRLGPAPARQSYLDVAAVVAAARGSGAEALHPGYGFLSENPALARACREAGVVFVGPPADAIDLMGSKIAAKELAQRVGVPVVPGYSGTDQRDERLAEAAQQLGFPLLIKASAGGGGKGMRAVFRAHEFGDALSGARREAQAAFGDDAVLLERLVLRPRHVEIQVLADSHGAIVALGERECSIQRRHQKVVEECPSPVMTPALREQMGAAAVRLAQAAGYVNAGTVEFIVEDVGGELRFYFLEMNTRLQVEHPVTEWVCGIDLVQLQIAIAAGERLPFRQEDVTMRGHAIELRVYAEDPQSGLPATGTLALFAPPDGPGVRNDAGVATGDAVSVHYDPMLAKLIVAGADRAAAVRRLAAALNDYAVLGVATNLPLLRAIVAHPAFVAGETYTDFLSVNELPEASLQAVPVAALVAAALHDAPNASWRLHRAAQPLRYRAGSATYQVLVSEETATRWIVDISAEHAERAETKKGLPSVPSVAHTRAVVALLAQRAGEIAFTLRPADVEVGRLVRCRIAPGAGGELLLALRDEQNPLGLPVRLLRPAPLTVDSLGRGGGRDDRSSLAAPMPGTVVKLLVSVGESVAAGQPLLVLEAMKMEHTVAAPFAGTVRSLPYAAGQLVPTGAQLAEITPAG